MHISEMSPDDPRASAAIPGGDAMTKAQAAIDDLAGRLERLEAQPLKLQYTIERGQS